MISKSVSFRLLYLYTAFFLLKQIIAILSLNFNAHVLVAPLRPAERLCDLSPTEISDVFNTVQTVSNVIKKHFNGTSLTVAVQDGKDAGQTVKVTYQCIYNKNVSIVHGS